MAAAKSGIKALLGPPAEVRVAAVGPEDTLERWGGVFSTIQVSHTLSLSFTWSTRFWSAQNLHVAAMGREDTLERWDGVFSTIQVGPPGFRVISSDDHASFPRPEAHEAAGAEDTLGRWGASSAAAR